MAAYIDLNPLRAGLVEDPKDYRWCGYAEAVVGSKRARVGLCRVVEAALDSWPKTGGERYRRLLFSEGMERSEEKPAASEDVESGKGQSKRQRVRTQRGFRREEVLKKLKSGVALSRAELLRCKVRYFSDGLVLGSKDFVESAYQKKRAWFSQSRKKGARGHPESWGGFYSLR